MLGKLTRALPEDGYLYEPKWDGFRALAFKDGDEVELQSRHGRPFARYFPELVAALRELPERRCVLDGEILADDFQALMLRLHPARSRVEKLAAETPTVFIAFDLLAAGDEDLMERPFAERRRRLERLLAMPPASVKLTPQTADATVARGWLEGCTGIDGVMAKPAGGVYEPGARAMLKVKLERTADCVVAGMRVVDEAAPEVVSLLLGLYDVDGALRHVGVAASFGKRRGRELFERLRGLATTLDGHPWEHGFLLEGRAVGRLAGSAGRWAPGMTLDWVPLRPSLVAEVTYERVDEGRFRHPARLKRFRDDREPASCRFDQLDAA